MIRKTKHFTNTNSVPAAESQLKKVMRYLSRNWKFLFTF